MCCVYLLLLLFYNFLAQLLQSFILKIEILKAMNKAFQWCVDILVALAAKLNMTYEAVNIWIFVIIEPIVFFVMLSIIYKQQQVIKSLKQTLLP